MNAFTGLQVSSKFIKEISPLSFQYLPFFLIAQSVSAFTLTQENLSKHGTFGYMHAASESKRKMDNTTSNSFSSCEKAEALVLLLSQ